MDFIETYLCEIEQVIRNLSRDAVRKVADALMAAWRAQAQVFVCGNGGSAATASHMANDLNKYTCANGKPRFRAISLTDNISLMTAIGNDLSYADIFVEQLRNFMQKGDLLIAISGSGNSPNIIKAVEYVKQNGGTAIGFCGWPGGRLAELTDLKIIVPSSLIGQQEDGHMILDHVLAGALRERIQRSSLID
jgi:D-sedoheptulose 7-phosphate isomerase